jgi:hypothetical protein
VPVPGPLRLDFDAARSAGEVVIEAAPRPVFGLFDKAAHDRIAVHVTQLLHVLAVGEDVEIVVAYLPELGSVAFEQLRGFTLEDAEGCREGVELRFGDKQVNVLGHEDVAEDVKLMSSSDAFEGLLKDDARVVVVEVRKPAITAKGDEVVAAFGLVALQSARHGVIVTPMHPLPHPCPRCEGMNGAPQNIRNSKPPQPSGCPIHDSFTVVGGERSSVDHPPRA